MKKWATGGFFAAILLSLIVTLVATFCTSTALPASAGEYLSLEDGWTEQQGETASVLILNRILTQEDTAFSIFLIENEGQMIEVYLDGQLLSAYGTHEDLASAYPLGNISWPLALPRDFAAGLQLQVRVYAQGEATMPGFALCSASGYIFQFVRYYIPTFLSLAAIFIGCIYLAIIARTSFRSAGKWDSAEFWLLIFMIQAFIFILMDSRLPQVFGMNAAAACLLSVESFILLCQPFFRFMSILSPRFSKPALLFCGILTADFLVVNLLQVTGAVSILHSLVFTQMIVLLMILYTFFYMLQEWRKTHTAFSRSILISVAVLGTCGIAEILRLRLTKETTTSSLFSVGLALFSLIYFSHMHQRSSRMAAEGAKSEIYQRMALHDSLTGLFNRTAFTAEIERLSASSLPCRIGVLYGDLNNMKETNDAFGHEAGDRLIIGFAECFQKTIAGVGTSFRTGGDEFVALFTVTDITAEEMKNRLRATLQAFNETATCTISAALGCAEGDIRPGDGEAVKALVRAADDAMYEDKRHAHGGRLHFYQQGK